MVLYLNKKRTLKLRLPVQQERLQRILLTVIEVLSVAALILGTVGIAFFAQIKHVTLEAGEELSAADISRHGDACFRDFDPAWTSRPGVYYFTLISRGRERSVRLKVVDTKAPEVVIKEVKCAIGGETPQPMDFLESVNEADSCFGEYVTAFPEIKRMGEYCAQVRYSDPSGNCTKVLDVKMFMISDSEAPKITLESDEIELEVGERADLLKYVSVTDNCVGKLTVTVNDESVDYGTAGEYKAQITASDAVGNTSGIEIGITVSEGDKKDS